MDIIGVIGVILCLKTKAHDTLPIYFHQIISKTT